MSLPLRLCHGLVSFVLLAVTASARGEPPRHLGLCATCHGQRGIANVATIPNLAGQNLPYLREALRQYHSGARDHAAMRAAIGMLSEDELDRILRWYATQPRGEPAP
jgi:cytochrome c553